MKWRVETLNAAVDKEIAKLGVALQAKFLHISEMLERFGPDHVTQPYVKYLGDQLWEMRLHGNNQIARAIYITITDRRIIVLHAFIKKHKRRPAPPLKKHWQEKRKSSHDNTDRS